VDLLLDEDYHVWLLEFTRCPAMRMFPDFLRLTHTDLLHELVDILWDIENMHPSSEVFRRFVPVSLTG